MDWSSVWQLNINAAKCNALYIGRKPQDNTSEYYIDNVCLPRVNLVSDLGVQVDSNLSFSSHVAYVAKRLLIDLR